MIQVEAGAKTPSGPSNSASASRRSRGDLGPDLVDPVFPEAQHLARRAQRHVELDRVVEVVADLRGRSQRCRAICSKPAIFNCSLTVSALAIENGPGPQVGWSRLLGVLEVLVDDQLGAADPVVVLLAPPDDRAEPAAGGQRRAHVAQRGTGLAKNIRPMREKA